VKANQAELNDQAIKAGHNRIAALMRANGLRGVSRRTAWCVTTQPDKDQRPAPDLVKREFTATDINQLWVADMTYIPTWAGFVNLAVVLDVYSRKVVGWAFGQRQKADGRSGDCGLEYGADHTQAARCDPPLRPGYLECELIDRRSCKTFADARMAIFTWIQAWYNPRRRHSGIGQKSPINFDKELREKKDSTTQTPAKDGLPTGCFAPVDKPPCGLMQGPSACPQASPVDNPAPEHSTVKKPL
jgi:putative transposase